MGGTVPPDPTTDDLAPRLECVVNVSEGRHGDVIAAIGAAAGFDLLDVHSDPDHHRSVLTVVGETAPRAIAREAVARLDLRRHEGVHPRIGVVDVVPFVPLGGSMAEAIAARDRFANWAAAELGVPCFLYGPAPERSLPEIRRTAFRTLAPDRGPGQAHPTAGAIAVGARSALVAFNVWLAGGDLARARAVASAIRGPRLRALGFAVRGGVQVSMNLIEPDTLGPAQAYDLVGAHAQPARAELVGLLPEQVLNAVDPARWPELDLGPGKTVEYRNARRRAMRPGAGGG